MNRHQFLLVRRHRVALWRLGRSWLIDEWALRILFGGALLLGVVPSVKSQRRAVLESWWDGG